ncbi:MAG: hypothetical protein ACK6DG_11275, partial [Cyanobacteriota bacterium]
FLSPIDHVPGQPVWHTEKLIISTTVKQASECQTIKKPILQGDSNGQNRCTLKTKTTNPDNEEHHQIKANRILQATGQLREPGILNAKPKNNKENKKQAHGTEGG